MLLLHGYMSSKESFYYQTEFLSSYFRVTAPDFAGFGASESPDTAFSVGDYADWIMKFADAAKLEAPHVIAHSFGARVAIKLLAARGERFGKLVVTGGAGLVKPRSPEYIRRVKAYRRCKKLFPRFAEKHYGSEEYRKLSPLMRESYKKIVNEDLREYAARIKNQTLLLYGESDGVTPLSEEGETFAKIIVNSKLESAEGGHFCFSEHPAEFNSRILQFLIKE